MTNYGNGKIYKIERIFDNCVVYIGSTTKEYLSQRLVEHKSMSKRCPNRRIYKSINDNDGWENHQIILIKNYFCGSKDELRSEEARFIRVLKPICNIEIPMRTSKDYYLDNCEKLNKYAKEYRILNKEKGSKIINCCCGSTYTYQHKSKIIEEMQNNRKKIYISTITRIKNLMLNNII